MHIGFLLLTITARIFILDVWQYSEFASVVYNNPRKKSRLKCLTGFEFAFVVINDLCQKIHLRCFVKVMNTLLEILLHLALDVYQLEVMFTKFA